jgi:hypothetical protein
VFDAATSIGANSEEKESYETVFWLRLAIATGIVTAEEVAWELEEAVQLRAMTTQAVRTSQSSSWRGGT